MVLRSNHVVLSGQKTQDHHVQEVFGVDRSVHLPAPTTINGNGNGSKTRVEGIRLDVLVQRQPDLPTPTTSCDLGKALIIPVAVTT